MHEKVLSIGIRLYIERKQVPSHLKCIREGNQGEADKNSSAIAQANRVGNTRVESVKATP